MERKFKKFIADVGENAKGLLEKSKDKTIQAIDQNGDGKLDLTDVSEIAESIGNTIKKNAKALKEKADETSRQIQLKIMKPIVLGDLNGFSMPKFIRIADRDKKYSESDVCKGAIGFWTDLKGTLLMNIFRDSIEVYGLSFYPNCEGEFYYVNPVDKDSYIELDEYFDYLRQVRVGELQKIAQDLGAKHFRVTYKEERTSFSERKTNKKVGVKSGVGVAAEQKREENKYSRIEIAAEMECPGHDPVKPTIQYMKYDPNIQNLIKMRMDAQGPLNHQALTIKLSNSSGLKENEAVKIDAILKGMKCSGNSTVVNEARNESRRYLEYEIDF